MDWLTWQVVVAISTVVGALAAVVGVTWQIQPNIIRIPSRWLASIFSKVLRSFLNLSTQLHKIASFYRKWVHRRLFIDGYVSNHVKSYERDLVDSLLEQYRDAFNQANFSHLTLECKDDLLAQQLLDEVRHQGAGRMSALAYWIAQICPDDNPLDDGYNPEFWR